MKALKQFAIHQTIYVDVETHAEAEALASYIQQLIACDVENRKLFEALVDVEECWIDEIEEDEDD